MVKRTDRPGQDGFTLLEMLVTLVVLGLLIGGLAQSMRSGLALWAAEMRHIDGTAELDGAARVLRALLASMQPPLPTGRTAGALAPGAVTGDAGRLDFVGDLPTGLGTTRRADITIELRQQRLVLRWRPHDRGSSAVAAVEPSATELVRGVERLEFAYWSGPVPGDPGGWLARWRSSALPELIRVRIVFPTGDARRWPDLVAAPVLWAPPAGSAAAADGG